MGLNVGQSPVIAAYLGAAPVLRVMYGREEVWPLTTESMGDVVLVHRYSSLQSYDQALIDRLGTFGYTVTPVYQNDINTYDFSGAKIVIVGAPGTSSTSVSYGSTLANLNAHVIMMCRSTARNVFNMAGSSGGATSGQYSIKVVDHPVQLPSYSVGQDVNMGSSIHNQGIRSIRSGFTELAALNSSYAGIVVQDEGDFRRIFWGYYRFDTISDAGAALFRMLLSTEYPLLAPGFGALRWMGHVPNLAPDGQMPLYAPHILRAQPSFSPVYTRFVYSPKVLRVDPSFKEKG